MNASVMTQPGQYLTCRRRDEIYALDISRVREVLDFTTVTHVPHMPAFMPGVISLRGTAVPVVDLRLQFGMPKTERTVETCVIIVEVTVDGLTTVLGALTDSVQEVIDLEAGQIEPAPRIGTRLRTDFISGIGKQNGRFVIILNIDKVFSAGELDQVLASQEEFASPE